MSRLILVAPLEGWSSALDEVPDEVFAQRLLGDGVAIDPTAGKLHAPCAGEIVSVPDSCHAIAMRAVNGAEILMHVGIDTVALNGAGFELHTAVGKRVAAGDLLLSFDLDGIARRAKSVITPIVITNGERFSITSPHVDRRVSRGDVLFAVEPLATQSAQSPDARVDEQSVTVIVRHGQGIHARPAALIANLAKTYGAEITIARQGKSANARSAVSLMSLGIRRDDEIRLLARGADAAAALKALQQLLHDSAQHENQAHARVTEPAKTVATKAEPLSIPAPRTGSRQLDAVIGSRGFAVGKAVYLGVAEIAVAEAGQGMAHETAEFECARGEVRLRLQALAQKPQATAREIINAHLEFLDDWELVAAARRSIAVGKSAAYAWRRAVRDSADVLRGLDDPRMAERIDDLLDLEFQVLTALSGAVQPAMRSLPDRAIVLAEDLKPSQFITLEAGKLAGICTAAGGPTSHVAILAAAIGVPTLVAAGADVLEIPDGTWLVLDAETGKLHIAPDDNELAAAEQSLAVRRQRRNAEKSVAHRDCVTSDGVRIEVFANLGSLAEAQLAVSNGAEGCGLLRTEFLFLDRESPPDEAEQLRLYQDIAAALAGKPLVIRTLDIGGDKPLAYLPLPAEANPALGLRGVRTSLWREDLLRIQLRAILSVKPPQQCRLLLPMITDVAEVHRVRELIAAEAASLQCTAKIQVGAMIETPAAALLGDHLARAVDFFSIGTNDLTQYTLAIDRDHAELAARLDGLHPAVLRLIATTVAAAGKRDRLTAVCGGLASDPAAVPILIGLGVTELSVVPSLVPQLKGLIRGLTSSACQSLAAQALEQESAQAVRALASPLASQVTPDTLRIAL